MGVLFSPVFPLSSFVILCIDILLFFFVILQYTVDRDRSYLRFLKLISLFILYILTNSLFPNWNYSWLNNEHWSILFQNIITYSTGIILATYYFYYLIVEFDIKLGKLFNVKVLLISLFGAFLIGYCLTFVITQDKDVARETFFLFPSLIAFYFAFHTVKSIISLKNKKSNFYQKAVSFSGYLGIIFMATMPILLLLGDRNRGWNHFVINISLFLSFYSNLVQFIHHNRRFNSNTPRDAEELKYNDLKKKLTKREIEVVTCLGQLKSNKEIGELMFISVSTVRKHLSNIYEKAEVSDIKELKTIFPNINNHFYE